MLFVGKSGRTKVGSRERSGEGGQTDRGGDLACSRWCKTEQKKRNWIKWRCLGERRRVFWAQFQRSTFLIRLDPPPPPLPVMTNSSHRFWNISKRGDGSDRGGIYRQVAQFLAQTFCKRLRSAKKGWLGGSAETGRGGLITAVKVKKPSPASTASLRRISPPAASAILCLPFPSGRKGFAFSSLSVSMGGSVFTIFRFYFDSIKY